MQDWWTALTWPQALVIAAFIIGFTMDSITVTVRHEERRSTWPGPKWKQREEE